MKARKADEIEEFLIRDSEHFPNLAPRPKERARDGSAENPDGSNQQTKQTLNGLQGNNSLLDRAIANVGGHRSDQSYKADDQPDDNQEGIPAERRAYPAFPNWWPDETQIRWRNVSFDAITIEADSN